MRGTRGDLKKNLCQNHEHINSGRFSLCFKFFYELDAEREIEAFRYLEEEELKKKIKRKKKRVEEKNEMFDET